MLLSNLAWIALIVFYRSVTYPTVNIEFILPDRVGTRISIEKSSLRNDIRYTNETYYITFDDSSKAYIPDGYVFECYHSIVARTRSGQILPVETDNSLSKGKAIRELGCLVTEDGSGRRTFFEFIYGTSADLMNAR